MGVSKQPFAAYGTLPVSNTILASAGSLQGDTMLAAFNVMMRIVSTLLGVVMIAMGTVWILQGLNLAFRVGFMGGDKHWGVYGAILALLGIGQENKSKTRQVKR